MKTKADKIQRRVVNNYIKSRNPNQHDINTYVAAVCITQDRKQTKLHAIFFFQTKEGTPMAIVDTIMLYCLWIHLPLVLNIQRK